MSRLPQQPGERIDRATPITFTFDGKPVSGFAGDFAWIKEEVPKLKKYLECYDRYYFNEKCGLYVWADDVMIGVFTQ